MEWKILENLIVDEWNRKLFNFKRLFGKLNVKVNSGASSMENNNKKYKGIK